MSAGRTVASIKPLPDVLASAVDVDRDRERRMRRLFLTPLALTTLLRKPLCF